jgi:hypothetical protein
MRNFKKDQLPEELISFAERHLGNRGITAGEISWKQLKGDGSDRMLYRLSFSKGSVILVVNEHPLSGATGTNENDSFDYICHHLRGHGIDTPEIHEYRKDTGWFILEDLGEIHLMDEALKLKNNPVKLEELYKKVLDILPLIQVKGVLGFDTNKIHSAPYDRNFVREWESGYFFRSFLKGYLNLTMPEDFLGADFDSLADMLSSIDSGYFLYRDFQSKNIMITQRKIRFLDFQGGRKGPPHYDLASLMLDPYVELSDNLKDTLKEYYLTQLSLISPLDKEKFISEYPVIALHRNMQILGAFGYLSTVKKRDHFKQYIQPAIKSLKNLLNLDIFSPYKNLRKVVDNL